MDPLSALGIAASVVQFVQFSGSLVSKSKQIYKHGALLDHVECETATRRLTELSTDVESSLKDLEELGSLSHDAKTLKLICSNCAKLSEELISRLEKIQVNEKSKSRKWKSFRQALKSISTKDAVDSLARRIADCRDELNSHLIVSLRYVSFWVLE
jgi:predicted RNase H-like nuclease (RuvC/YqgF family)